MKKQISNRLDSTRNKNKKVWETYQRRKKKILSKKIPYERKWEQINELLEDRKKLISKNWSDYQDFKYVKTHKSKLPYFKLQGKTKKLATGKLQNYKLQSLKGLTNLAKNEKELSKIRYILVILKIKIPETDIITYTSDSYTPLSIKGKTGTEIQKEIIQKLSFQNRYEGFELLGTYVKIIYEKAKKS